MRVRVEAVEMPSRRPSGVRHRSALLLSVLAILPACGAAPAAPAPANPALLTSDAVFDPTVLHQIRIGVDSKYLETLDGQLDERVPCTFVFDGIEFPMAGIRRKGGINTLAGLNDKPSLSIKLNAFYGRQRLGDLDKLILNNGMQDAAFVNEHLGYALYRRAGLVAPRTALARVELNGQSFGIYVLREAIDRQFIERNFGRGSSRGNLYEGSCPFDDPCTDFVRLPERMELKRDRRDNRSRRDLERLVRAIRDTPDEDWEAAVRSRFDLDAFITSYAIDALAAHWDSYAYNMNNYYLFHRPSDDRFVLIPHGMDSAFGVDGVYDEPWDRPDPLERPVGYLAQKVWDEPSLRQRFRNELQRLFDEVWQVETMLAEIEQVRSVIHSAESTDLRTRQDLAGFARHIETVVEFISTREDSVFPVYWLSRLNDPENRR